MSEQIKINLNKENDSQHADQEKKNILTLSTPLPELVISYQNVLDEMTEHIAKNPNEYENIKEIDRERKIIKSLISEKINGGFKEQAEENKDFSWLSDLCAEINKLDDRNESLEKRIIKAFKYAGDVLDRAAHGDKRPNPSEEGFLKLKAEFERLAPIFRRYLEPQNLVSDKNKREPSIYESIVATAELVEIRNEVVEKIKDFADAVVVAGSLSWGANFDTRGLGTNRYLKGDSFVNNDHREQFTISKIISGDNINENEKKIIKERAESELSDVDIVIVADKNENIREIYDKIFAGKIDKKAAINTKTIKKFLEILSDSSIPDNEKPVSVNLDYVAENGFLAQLIIFSNCGFNNLYKYNINDLEKFSEDDNQTIPHFKLNVEISDMENGGSEKKQAIFFSHNNLAYTEGEKDAVTKKANKGGVFEQALIGGKRIIGSYPSKVIGEAVLIDKQKDIYGQFYVKSYPFGGFIHEDKKRSGSYFLGFNTDNMITGENYSQGDTESSRVARDFKFKYFERIAKEQKDKNDLSHEELIKAPADHVFGPYLSRWPRIPEHMRRQLFGEFRVYLEKEDIEKKPNKDYYFASLPTVESLNFILDMQKNVIQKQNLNEVIEMSPDYLHLTEFYLPSLEKIQKIIGKNHKLNTGAYKEMFHRINASGKKRTFTIKDARAMGDKAISFILEPEKSTENNNLQIYDQLINYLKDQDVSQEKIDMLFADESLSFRFHQPSKFIPHITIAKCINDAEKLIVCDSLKRYVGKKVFFQYTTLREN